MHTPTARRLLIQKLSNKDSGKAKQFGAIGHGYHSVDRIVLGGFETEDGLVAEGQKVLESNFLYHIVSIVSGCKDTTFI